MPSLSPAHLHPSGSQTRPRPLRPAFDGAMQSTSRWSVAGSSAPRRRSRWPRRAREWHLLEARTIASARHRPLDGQGLGPSRDAVHPDHRGVGREAAAAYAGLNLDGVAKVVGARRPSTTIECSLETAPNYLYAAGGERRREGRSRGGGGARRAGLEVELTDETDLPFDVPAAAPPRAADRLRLRGLHARPRRRRRGGRRPRPRGRAESSR